MADLFDALDRETLAKRAWMPGLIARFFPLRGLHAEDFQGGSEDGGLEEGEELFPSLASNSAIRACCSASVRLREVQWEHAAAVASSFICFCIVLLRAKL